MLQPIGHHLAELNIGRVRLDDPRMADFTDNLDLVNGLAERSPGFVRRYVDDSGNATATDTQLWKTARCAAGEVA